MMPRRPPDTLGWKLGLAVGGLVGITALALAGVSAMGCGGVAGPCRPDAVPLRLVLSIAVGASLVVHWLIGRMRR